MGLRGGAGDLKPASDRTRSGRSCYAGGMGSGKPPEAVWVPIADLPADAASWGSSHYRERVRGWRDVRARLEDPAVDRTLLDIWLRERSRAFAIETGQIEGLYTLRRGVTEQLIAEGFEGVRAAHAFEPGLSDRTLKGLLEDQHAAVELVFEARGRAAAAVAPHHEELAPAPDPPPGARAGRARRAAGADSPAPRRLQGVAEQPAAAGRRRPRVLSARADAQRDGPAAGDAPRACGPRPADGNRGGPGCTTASSASTLSRTATAVWRGC